MPRCAESKAIYEWEEHNVSLHRHIPAHTSADLQGTVSWQLAPRPQIFRLLNCLLMWYNFNTERALHTGDGMPSIACLQKGAIGAS